MQDPNLTVAEPGRHESPEDTAAPLLPQQIGRYRVERVLGRGGFGIVYLAHDDQLHRPVAIKVPHPDRVERLEDAEAYLAEARTVAGLDHPHVVPVYDVGSTDQFPCFVVSKYIDGVDLSTRLKHSRLPLHEAVELTATVAEALHHAHKQGLVHRDVKPGNILLDSNGRPFVADFGLALREQDVGKGPRYAGTPAYMSPEQARGEGHRVDGRSDVFSLGVVFYELLIGRRPFHTDTRDELLAQVTGGEVRPPRQWDDAIPKELERICLKALSKRASDRYTTAKDMADDLRHFQAEQTLNQQSGPAVRGSSLRPATAVVPSSTAVASGRPGGAPATPATPTSDHQPIKIVPKGLRSFDAHDADFFLELLPGPRDRDGLPDSIRFWKTRVEATDPEDTFTVGLIYGPSGCGKSSLVKAGLLPHLSASVIAVYIEATAQDTEARLLNGLRKRCPALPESLGLKETLAALRRGQGVPVGKKVLIVLDQFEQWLHVREQEENSDLVQALRQCDGGRVQCVVLVRGDFWMAATRFMRDLEVRLVEGQNSAAVDLFPVRHAEKVLAAFGRAFGVLPEHDLSKDQKHFVEQGVAGLAQEGKVISVRLALFAEMMKGKAWTPGALKEVGGTEGVGVTFLEETFSAATAPPEHRYHQKAARAVLKGLLPEAGTDIKGHMRSHGQLLGASGYAGRPKDFDDLIRILDGEVRLITPTDPEGKEGAEGPTPQARPGEKYYQLTHDYLVHPLRDWLTRKQKETRRGRAELLLADRAGVWNARPENRQLPSLLQWLQIGWLTARETWTQPQKKMMSRAGRYHAGRGVVAGLLLAVATVTGLVIRDQVADNQKATRAAGLVQRVLDAETAQVPGVVEEMAEYRRWIDPLLKEANDKPDCTDRQKLHASLALLPADPGQVDYLSGRLLDARPEEVPVIRDALAPHRDALLDRLWAVAERPDKGQESRRLRAAAALAKYDPGSDRWKPSGPLVVNDLVRENPVYLGRWIEMYRPVTNALLGPLTVIFQDRRPDRAAERSLATNLLAEYAADEETVLADLLLDADEKQFAVLYPRFWELGDRGLPLLAAEIDRKLPADLPSSDPERERLAKRQANAAVALLRLHRPEKVWPLLKHSPDPRVRSHLIHRLSPLGADVGAILRRMEEETDVTVRRALLLSLGEYGEEGLPAASRPAILSNVQALYRGEADPGLHAAAEWLLRQWQQEAWLKQVNEEWAKDREGRDRRLEKIQEQVKRDGEKTPPRWYVNSQGQTMVVIPGPVEFVMGSPATEEGRLPGETQHRRRIGRSYALAGKAVTMREFGRFVKENELEPWFESRGQVTPLIKQFSPGEDGPAIFVDWYAAAGYCNWLSRQEGLEECYDWKAGTVKPKENYLGLSGYRLPTEAEVEYAARVGAVTSRCYGETEELLERYGWYRNNSQERTWPVGRKKPNDLGLFDLHSNVAAWCQERHQDYPALKGGEAVEDEEDDLRIQPQDFRVVRGGSFVLQASQVRCPNRE